MSDCFTSSGSWSCDGADFNNAFSDDFGTFGTCIKGQFQSALENCCTALLCDCCCCSRTCTLCTGCPPDFMVIEISGVTGGDACCTDWNATFYIPWTSECTATDESGPVSWFLDSGLPCSGSIGIVLVDNAGNVELYVKVTHGGATQIYGSFPFGGSPIDCSAAFNTTTFDAGNANSNNCGWATGITVSINPTSLWAAPHTAHEYVEINYEEFLELMVRDDKSTTKVSDVMREWDNESVDDLFDKYNLRYVNAIVNGYTDKEGNPFSDEEVEKFLSSTPIQINEDVVIDGASRVYRMINRLLNGQSYIPLTKQQRIPKKTLYLKRRGVIGINQRELLKMLRRRKSS